MARALSALLLLLGCADPTRPIVQPHLDFGLAMSDPDLAVGDLAMPPDEDLATNDPDLSVVPDLAAVDAPLPDLAPGPSCNDAGTTGHLFLAGTGASNALVTSRFTEGGGWTAYDTATLPTVSDVAQGLYLARPLLLAREKSDNTLSQTGADPCTQDFPSLSPIGFNIKTGLRPRVAGTDVLFRGATPGDLNLYYMYMPSTIWLGPTKQNNMTTTSEFALLHFDGKLLAFYSDGGKLTEGEVRQQLGGGPSAQVLTLTTSQPPAAVVDGNGNLNLVFVGTDTNLYWIWRGPGGGWLQANLHQLCAGQSGCLIDTTMPIALAVDSAGMPSVVWRGINDKKLYSSTLLTTSGPQYWSAARLASGTCGTKDCDTTVPPALATGIGSAQLELVFVSDLDGRARHARLLPADMGSAWSEPISLSGTNLLNTPSLVAQP
jgi:hypothetical protein